MIQRELMESIRQMDKKMMLIQYRTRQRVHKIGQREKKWIFRHYFQYKIRQELSVVLKL
jgi:hypothetical protein